MCTYEAHVNNFIHTESENNKVYVYEVQLELKN